MRLLARRLLPLAADSHRASAVSWGIPAEGAGEYLFTGHRWDPETGLYYARNNELDPTTGRWIAHDRASDDLLGNLYGYAGGNPVNWVDPLGLDTVDPYIRQVNQATGQNITRGQWDSMTDQQKAAELNKLTPEQFEEAHQEAEAESLREPPPAEISNEDGATGTPSPGGVEPGPTPGSSPSSAFLQGAWAEFVDGFSGDDALMQQLVVLGAMGAGFVIGGPAGLSAVLWFIAGWQGYEALKLFWKAYQQCKEGRSTAAVWYTKGRAAMHALLAALGMLGAIEAGKPLVTRSVGELIDDIDSHPGDWELVSEESEASSKKGGRKSGLSTRKVYRNKKTGETLERHEVVDDKGRPIKGHPHYGMPKKEP